MRVACENLLLAVASRRQPAPQEVLSRCTKAVVAPNVAFTSYNPAFNHINHSPCAADSSTCASRQPPDSAASQLHPPPLAQSLPCQLLPVASSSPQYFPPTQIGACTVKRAAASWLG